jgi:undecaprenyl-phosphate 4-deoxy-4-formamido-L-arabinose transferase
MATDLLRLSLVVPVYRSEPILADLVAEVARAMAAEGLAGQFELVLVNDASPDASWSVIETLARQHDFIKGIDLRKNVGQHSATMAGLNHARGRYVVVMDDDLQHPPAEIGNMVRALESGFDVCYTRYGGRQHVLWKRAGSWFNDKVATRFLKKPPGLYLSSFKAMRYEVVREVIKYDGPYAYLDGLILEVTRSITAVDIAHQPRREGQGNYNLRRSISLWLRMTTGFSILPLRIATLSGFALAALSLVVIAIVVVNRLRHPEWPAGWASLIATSLFVGGVQTFCIGMLGEYLGRMYLKINGKPQYVVRATTDDDRPVNDAEPIADVPRWKVAQR